MLRSPTPRQLLLALLLLLVLGAAGLTVSQRVTSSAPIATTTPAPFGYQLATLRQLRKQSPRLYWTGTHFKRFPLLISAVGDLSHPGSATVYYGNPAELPSLAIFLLNSTEAAAERRRINACLAGSCGKHWKLKRFRGGVALVKQGTKVELAQVLIGSSPLYVNCDLPGVSLDEVLASLIPISRSVPRH